jgi:hypothetical protein
MDPRNAAERAQPTGSDCGDPEALEFVRFCYRRRRVGWPELYDEMWAVAGRGLYRGYDADDLSAIGIGFGLYQMPALAAIVQRVVGEDVERRRLAVHASRTVYVAADDDAPVANVGQPAPARQPVDAAAEPVEQLPTLVPVALGA